MHRESTSKVFQTSKHGEIASGIKGDAKKHVYTSDLRNNVSL